MGGQYVLAKADVPPKVRVGGVSRSDEGKHNEHRCGENQVLNVAGLHREVILPLGREVALTAADAESADRVRNSTLRHLPSRAGLVEV